MPERASTSQPLRATAEPGGVVVLGLGLGASRISAPCRVVYVIDEPDRRGFAYGTLPGHPERGEEAFIISRHRDATVTFTITAFSRPASPLGKAAGPAGRAVQRRITSPTCGEYPPEPAQHPSTGVHPSAAPGACVSVGDRADERTPRLGSGGTIGL